MHDLDLRYDTRVHGRPVALDRCDLTSAVNRSSSRATRTPQIEVSPTSARHSRVQSSATTKLRMRRPSTNRPATNPSDQHPILAKRSHCEFWPNEPNDVGAASLQTGLSSPRRDV